MIRSILLLLFICPTLLHAADAEKAKNATGIVRSRLGAETTFCSAVYVGKGVWLTAAHVIKKPDNREYSSLTVTIRSKDELSAKVVGVVDRDEGCAAIKTIDVDSEITPFEIEFTEVQEGQTVYEIGYDLSGRDWLLKSASLLNSASPVIWPAKVTRNVIGKKGYIEAVGTGVRKSSLPGNAGGATLDENGKLLTIQYASTSLSVHGTEGGAVSVSQSTFKELVESIK